MLQKIKCCRLLALFYVYRIKRVIAKGLSVLKRYFLLPVIILLFLIAAIILTPLNVKIFYYQTSPLRLVKADVELSDLRLKNCTVKGMRRYIEFVKKTYGPGAYMIDNIEAQDDEEIVKNKRLSATRSGIESFRYKLVEQTKDSATIILYIETNRDESNKPRSKGNYYSFEGPTYKLTKENGKWIIAEKQQELRAGKPVIYLYPSSEQMVSVKLDFKGELTCTYPDYQGEWKVLAHPDGILTDISDNREYSYLFWEGIYNNKWDMSKGFVVKGTDTEKFLREKLEYLGLTPKEYNEFIVYWLPIMQKNKYNLVTFAGEDYETIAQFKITPQPDSILRVMMVFKPLNEPVAIADQKLKPFIRKGFTVVEWGGTEVR